MRYRFCGNCQKSTIHEQIRVSAFGDTDEPAIKRVAIGLFTAGFSEIMSEYANECQECGRRTQ